MSAPRFPGAEWWPTSPDAAPDAPVGELVDRLRWHEASLALAVAGQGDPICAA